MSILSPSLCLLPISVLLSDPRLGHQSCERKAILSRIGPSFLLSTGSACQEITGSTQGAKAAVLRRAVGCMALLSQTYSTHPLEFLARSLDYDLVW